MKTAQPANTTMAAESLSRRSSNDCAGLRKDLDLLLKRNLRGALRARIEAGFRNLGSGQTRSAEDNRASSDSR